MFSCTRYTCLLITACIVILSAAFTPAPVQWVIIKGTYLKVDGSTNINKFSCEIDNYNNPDTIQLTKNNSLAFAMKGNLSLNVEGFDCHNAMMTKDLRITLNMQSFPRLSIRFLSLNNFEETIATQNLAGWVEIEIAGVARKFDVNYQYRLIDGKTVQLKGIRAINFSDFNLLPPRKLGGMIKANDRLDVEFQLIMKTL